MSGSNIDFLLIILLNIANTVSIIGIANKQIGISKVVSVTFLKPSKAITDLIRYYTREAGVRGLERQVATVCRKAAKIIVAGEKKKVTVSSKVLVDMLGKHRFRYGQAETENQVGVATGLAYTTAGGDTLQIEVSLTPGKGKLILTGKLGDVMKDGLLEQQKQIFNTKPTTSKK